MTMTRRALFVVLLAGLLLVDLRGQAAIRMTEMAGRPTASSVTVNTRSDTAAELYYEYGRASGVYDTTTPARAIAAAEPTETTLSGLVADTTYYYRARYRPAGSTAAFASGTERWVATQRRPGSTFTFAAQGDSHPEREQTMFNGELYSRTLRAAAAERPDFYLTSGDDFSVDTLRTYSKSTVEERYLLQLPYLSQVGAPVFLVNGNHEQAARYLLDGTPDNVAVWAQNARNRYFPQPAPDGFYSGNTELVPYIGQLRNYYAWEWGDALFVVIDPYWSSPVAVDSLLGGRARGNNDRWEITHGDAQYEWLRRTLSGSRARWKFVFAHHVLGGGRGGVEVADSFEWGGRDAAGRWVFDSRRPGWSQTIHQLFVANGVTIFFQGHDHLFARQELDGVVYQELPNPADNTYTAFNADAYVSGDKLPNSGYVRVTVSPDSVAVAYIRMFLPSDERAPDRVSGAAAYQYVIPARR